MMKVRAQNVTNHGSNCPSWVKNEGAMMLHTVFMFLYFVTIKIVGEMRMCLGYWMHFLVFLLHYLWYFMLPFMVRAILNAKKWDYHEQLPYPKKLFDFSLSF